MGDVNMKLLKNDVRVLLRLLFLFCIFALSTILLAQGNAQAASIYDIQSTVDASGESTFAGQEVTISGIVTATFFDGYMVAEAPGPWQAIYVYSMRNGPDIGDEVEVTGTVHEYNGMTEVTDVTSFQHLSSGNSVDSTIVSVGEVSQEQYESVLITAEDVFVAELLDYGEWAVSDNGIQYFLCDDKNDYMYFPKEGDSLESVTGILFYTHGFFKLEPRETQDINSELIPHYALHGDVVTMNDSRDVEVNAYVEISGDEIVAIRSSRPTDIPVFEAGGLIFPGLIDSHNHPPYNVLGIIPFQTLFTERYEWQSHSLYAAFDEQLDNIINYGGIDAQGINAIKLAEVRALTAGTTSIQGLNCNSHGYDGFAHQGIVIDNIERSPTRAHSEAFPLQQEVGFWEELNGEYWDRFIIHLSEGTSPAALEEFYDWQGMGMLDARTTIIHGVPYGPAEWSAMAAAEANLIWSPMSSLILYGSTANVPEALDAGVNVALSPDWTESGTINILEELKVADRHNQEEWGGVITPLQFAEFVTCNAAKASGTEKIAGQIAPGLRANLMVIPGSPGSPYDALLRAVAADVKLTVVNGRPMYGDPGAMAQFSFADNVETIQVGGKEKRLSIQMDAHAIPESDKPFDQVLAELEEAYEASSPKTCAFVGINGGIDTTPQVEDFSNVFSMTLTPGLNMISVPLKPANPYTARSLAEYIGSTVVIKYDEALGKYVGFDPNGPGDGFPIEGGRGYIVNVPAGGTVSFTGAAWTNDPPAETAPPVVQSISAWAFVLSGSMSDGDGLSVSDGDYTIIVENLRTGGTFQDNINSSGYFVTADADLTRRPITEVGDTLEISVTDSSGELVSGPFAHEVTLDEIRNAVANVQFKLGDIIPAESMLLQNYPNPFNPETWIPYHLRDANPVSIRICSATGQLIRTLDLGHQDAGIYTSRSRSAYWDGRNEAGEQVSSGIYFYTIRAGEYNATGKMVVTR